MRYQRLNARSDATRRTVVKLSPQSGLFGGAWRGQRTLDVPKTATVAAPVKQAARPAAKPTPKPVARPAVPELSDSQVAELARQRQEAIRFRYQAKTGLTAGQAALALSMKLAKPQTPKAFRK